MEGTRAKRKHKTVDSVQREENVTHNLLFEESENTSAHFPTVSYQTPG